MFSPDIGALPEPQKAAWRAAYTDATYAHVQFCQDVLSVLRDRFSADVQEGKRAVQIKANGNRRKADVLITLIHKRYISFDTIATEKSVDGVAFWKLDGTKVINYPNLHRDNLVAKNKETNEWFKHIIRIFKNARQRMLESGIIKAGTAPSYYIEGLLYNAPTEFFGTSYDNSMVKCINWLSQADRSKFVCANRQYLLLDGNTDVTWNSQDCSAFLAGLAKLWNGLDFSFAKRSYVVEAGLLSMQHSTGNTASLHDRHRIDTARDCKCPNLTGARVYGRFSKNFRIC